jgi:hypothetical protein
MVDAVGRAKRPDLSCVSWRKSSHSETEGCVEVAVVDDVVAVRDSKDAGGPALVFAREDWRAFVLGARAGEFDRP